MDKWVLDDDIDVIKASDNEVWVYPAGGDAERGYVLSITPMGTILVNDREEDLGDDFPSYLGIFDAVADKPIASITTIYS